LVSDQVIVQQNLVLNIYLLLDFGQFHTILPETVLSSLLNIRDALHGLDSLDVEISVVLLGSVSFLFKVVNRVVHEFFIVDLAIGFGPG
jgi:hypothetical protein